MRKILFPGGLICVLILLSYSRIWAQACDSSFTFIQSPTQCAVEPVQFFANAMGNNVTYDWNFGFGFPSNDKNPVVTYPLVGGTTTYNVSLTVMQNGLTCTSVQQVTIQGTTVITAAVDTVLKCGSDIPDSTLFSPTITTSGVPATALPLTWDFGNDTTVTGVDLSQTAHYICFGTYPVTITAAGETCPGYVQEINYYTDFAADVKICDNNSIVCEGDTICVANATVTKCNNISQFNWEWGLGGPVFSTTTTDTVFYAYNFSYDDLAGPTGSCILPPTGLLTEVELEGQNLCYTLGTTQDIVIRPRPHVSASILDTVCIDNGIVTITNATCPGASYPLDPTTYFWDFGAAGTSTQSDPVIDFGAFGPGVYPIEMIASNSCGSDTLRDTVRVIEPPTAYFEPDTNRGCADFCLSITNLTTPDTLTAFTSFFWEVLADSGWYIPAPDQNTDFQPGICFTLPDTYVVRLIAENFCGRDTMDTTIFVNISPQLVIDTLPEGIRYG